MPSHTARTTRIALAISVLGAVIGLAPAQSATAVVPVPPFVYVTPAPSLDLYGPSQEFQVEVDKPPTSDVYLRLEISGGDQSDVQLTDASGNDLPLGPGTGAYAACCHEVTVGEEDSDGNGVPGTPMADGATMRLRVRAEYPITRMFTIAGLLIDGATGKTLNSKVSPAAQFVDGVPTPSPGLIGPLTVATGLDPAVLWLRTGMVPPKSVAPPVSHTRLLFSHDQLATAGYTADQFIAGVKLTYATGAGTGHFTSLAWRRTADGSVSADLPAIDWGGLNVTYFDQDLGFQAVWGFPTGRLTGSLEVFDAQGRQYYSGSQELDFTADQRPADHLAAFYGRDAFGYLWQYKGWPDADGPQQLYTYRYYIGRGWNTYITTTALSPLKADGTGDMVARDRSGVLWYYRGTGVWNKPFAARIRIGGGWNIYTALTGVGDLNRDGYADLIARDAAGVLWLYRGTGKTGAPFGARTRIGGGWNAYNLLTQAGDLNGDGRTDLLARDSAGVLWLYRGTGNAAAPYTAREQIGSGWQIYTRILGIGDLLADGHPDIVAADKAGHLWYYAGTGNTAAPYKPRVDTGTGWGIYTNLL